MYNNKFASRSNDKNLAIRSVRLFDAEQFHPSLDTFAMKD